MFVLLKKFVLIILFIVFSACSVKYTSTQNNIDYMYAKSIYYFNKGNLDKAKSGFLEIVQQYPFKEEAVEAQVLLIWIYFLQSNYDNAELDLDSFLKFYVFNSYTQWAVYMQGVVKYQKIGNKLNDQSNTTDALDIFIGISKNFNNNFSKDSKLKVEVLKHFLASRSMEIATFYVTDKRYLAALNRYNEVINYFPDTVFVQEALYRSAELWILLGMPEEAFKSISVLGYNYSNSKWYVNGNNLIKKYTSYNQNSVLNKE